MNPHSYQASERMGAGYTGVTQKSRTIKSRGNADAATMSPRMSSKRSMTERSNSVMARKTNKRSVTVCLPLPYLEKQFEGLGLLALEGPRYQDIVESVGSSSFCSRDLRDSSVEELSSDSEVDEKLSEEPKKSVSKSTSRQGSPHLVEVSEDVEHKPVYECDVEVIDLNVESEPFSPDLELTEKQNVKPNVTAQAQNDLYGDIRSLLAQRKQEMDRKVQRLDNFENQTHVIQEVFSETGIEKTSTGAQLDEEIAISYGKTRHNSTLGRQLHARREELFSNHSVPLKAAERTTSAPSVTEEDHSPRMALETNAFHSMAPIETERVKHISSYQVAITGQNVHRPLRDLIYKANKNCYQVDSNRVMFKVGLSRNTTSYLPHLHARFDAKKD